MSGIVSSSSQTHTLQTVIEQTGGLAYIVAAEPPGRLSYLSSNLRALLKWPTTDGEPDNWYTLVDVADRSRVGALWQRVAAGNGAEEGGYRLCTATGDVITVRDHVMAVPSDGGKTVLLGMLRPEAGGFSAAGNAEDPAMQRRRDLLLQLANALPQLLWTAPPTGEADYFNQRWHSYTGRGPDGSIGLAWLEAIHPQDKQEAATGWDAARREHRSFVRELRLAAADGSYRWFLGQIVPLLDHDGSIVRWFGTFTDIEEQKQLQYQAHERENELQLILDHLPVAVWLVGDDGRVLRDNPASVRIWGRRFDSIDGGDQARAWWTQSGQPLTLEDWSVRRVLAGHQAIVGELIDIEDTAGHRKTILSSALPVRHGSGHSGVVAINEDVTALRRTEQSLRFHARLLDAVGQAVIATSTDGIVIYWNQAAEALYGWSSAEAVGRGVMDLLVQDATAPEAEVVLERVRRGETWTGEFLIRHRSGHLLPVLVTDAPIFDSHGNLTGIIGVSSDLTERRQIEQEREELLARERAAHEQAEGARRRIAFLAEASLVLAAGLDYEQTLERIAQLAAPAIADWCTVTVLNEDGASSWSVAHESPERAEALRALQRLHPSLDNDRHPVAHVAASGESVLIPDTREGWLESWALDQDHLAALSRFDFRSAMLVPLRVRGRTLGVMAFLSSRPGRHYDQEDLLLAEELAYRAATAVDNAHLYRQAREAVGLRDAFISSLAHDLKNPIATVMGMSEFIRRLVERSPSPETERITRGANGITSSAGRMVIIINELMDIARLQAGRPLELNRSTVDIVALARQCAAEHQLTSDLHQVAVEPNQPVITGKWDGPRIERVLSNLLSNAIKYSPDGGAVTVTLSRQPSGGTSGVLVTVSDPGLGVPEADLPKVFSQFNRGSNVTNKIPGTGIGLAGARQVVERHDGWIRLASVEGEGTTVTFWLPLEPPLPMR